SSAPRPRPLLGPGPRRLPARRLRRRPGRRHRLRARDLPAAGGDAEAWLEEQARSEGWSRAERLRGRRATQGLVGLLQDRGLAVMVEVNCETDFVARNEEFQRLLQQAVLGTMAHCQGRAEPLAAPAKHFLQSEELLQLRAEPHGARLGDQVALAIGECPTEPAGRERKGRGSR
uniref:Ts translation elongation factor, mitochondrial n=1 Tax=Nothoprocta perdicaria TaxID=30464 RepID=A0A8C6ZJH8_NOTPE